MKGSADLAVMVASGDGGGSQGLVLVVLLLVAALFVVVVNIVNRFRQPFVVVLEHPFRFLMKTIMFGVTSTAVVAVTVVSIIIVASGSPS